jgi:threonine/homoserine/homoserine lactone efflux protein
MGISYGLKIISGTMLIVLGFINFFKKPKKTERKPIGEKRNAFMKGLIISSTNPLAVPFWLAVTAYLEGIHWIALTDKNYLYYVLGISIGTFSLLALVANIGNRFSALNTNPWIIYKIPGLAFVVMGCWIFIQP